MTHEQSAEHLRGVVADVFSKRNVPLPDVFYYDDLPTKLRVQLVHWLQDAIGSQTSIRFWSELENTVAREHGHLKLPVKTGSFRPPGPYSDCRSLILQGHVSAVLDLLELAVRGYETDAKLYRPPRTYANVPQAIADLNHRFRENGVGFQYEGGALVRVDSHLLHAGVVQPVLRLLSAPGFDGPNSEFMAAHEHYRHGRTKEAITAAGCAFESTMKAICDARGWAYKPKPTAGQLITVLVDNGLVPGYSRDQLNNLTGCLTGVATVRNSEGAHGVGAEQRDVSEHTAGYALHLAAANILYLVECHLA